MSSIFSLGEVISCVDGEILIYGWLEPDEAIKAIEDYFDEVVQPSNVKSNVDYGNTFHVEITLTDIQASITRAKNVLGV